MWYLTLILTCVNCVNLIESGNSISNITMAKNLPETMKAVGLFKYLPILQADSLVDLQVKLPELRKNDVLIKVEAISVNPIDTKVRAPKPIVEAVPKILGWDGAGVIVDKGNATKLGFNIGDEVFFYGDIERNGCNAQYVAVDEVIVGPKPRNFTFEQAAAMPLTTLTAFEALYDRLLLTEADKGKTLLIINGAGGVGSIASQLAKNLGLTVISTAARPETENFTKEHGADIVLNHKKDLIAQLKSHGYEKGVDYILVNYDPYPYWDILMEVIKPQGRICLIVDSSGLVDLRPLKAKSITLVSEMLATRIKYDTEDKIRLHEMITQASQMFENGQLKCTLTKTMSPINAENLKKAHQIIEEKKMVGKLVLTGF